MKWLIATVLSFCLLACEPVTSYEPESRPDKVPVSAIWIGGPDGGVYALVRSEKRKYSGIVYYENSGDIWYEGDFTYTGEQPFDVTEQSLYSAWDGDVLYLVNGEQLVADHAP